MEKAILRLLGVMVVFFCVFGIIGPALISMKGDIPVVGGVVLVGLTIYYGIKYLIKQFKTIQKYYEEN